jgi:hypothetical protein
VAVRQCVREPADMTPALSHEKAEPDLSHRLLADENEAGLPRERAAVGVAVELDLREARLACQPLELAGRVNPEPILDGDRPSTLRPVREANFADAERASPSAPQDKAERIEQEMFEWLVAGGRARS